MYHGQSRRAVGVVKDMDLFHHDTGAALLERAGDFLRQRETLHSLILVLAARPVEAGASQPYFATVEDEEGVALVALRTGSHNVVLSTLRDGASEDALALVAADLAGRGHSLPGANGHADTVLAFAPRWEAAVGVRSRVRLRFAAFELEHVIAPAWPPGDLRLATESELDTLVDWTNRFIDETGLPEEDRPFAARDALSRRVQNGAIHVWSVDGAAVTMAAATGGSSARIGGVYTPPELRRRGYASASVARLSQRLLDGGARKVTLSADVANPTSNKIYAAIGYRRVGDEVMVAFER